MEKVKIFLDLDGVFADLDKLIAEVCGVVPRHSNDIWGPLSKEWRPFYRLDLITDALRIITHLQHHDLEFLSALPESRPHQPGLSTANSDKRAWVAEKISKHIPVNTVVGGKNKYRWLEQHPGAVLIDDYKRNIDLWNDAGGLGILHETYNTDSTLEQCRILGLI